MGHLPKLHLFPEQGYNLAKKLDVQPMLGPPEAKGNTAARTAALLAGADGGGAWGSFMATSSARSSARLASLSSSALSMARSFSFSASRSCCTALTREHVFSAVFNTN